MSWLTQIFTVTLLNLRTIPRRLGSSTVAVIGIAGVVIVFVAVLSMAEGFFNAMRSAGAADRALVMRSGADDEKLAASIANARKLGVEGLTEGGVKRGADLALRCRDLRPCAER